MKSLFWMTFFVTICSTDKLLVIKPLWSWECVNERCVPMKPTADVKLQSLETCNMLCSGIQLWPQPTGAVSLATSAVLIRTEMIRLDNIQAPSNTVRLHLQDAFDLFLKELKRIEFSPRGLEKWYNVIVNITVTSSEDPRMLLDTNESYHLSIQPMFASAFTIIADIKSPSFCGARHGIESLSQLIWLDTNLKSLLIIHVAEISDSPKFPYRGLMLDTARTYISVPDIMRTLDAMAASKLNTFHWHISDAQAFALRLNSVPQLAEFGAFNQNDMYSVDQVKVLVRRARLRGIRILIEVDTPAHVGQAWSWGNKAGLHDLVYCLDSEPWTAFCSEPPCGQLNPHNNHVYEILLSVYYDIMQLTGVDDLVHLGGDDVSMKCWMGKGVDPMKGWIYFTKTALHCLEAAQGKLPNLTLFWYSHLSGRIKTDLKDFAHAIGLQIRSVGWAKRQVRGIRTVLSHEDAWDLNSGTGHWYEEAGAPYNSWQRVYEHRPWSRDGSDIIGGEGTVWSGGLNRDNLDSRIWPRAAALAERLWTDRPEGATKLVHARLDVHRTRLVAKNVKPAPLWSYWCTQNTYTCT